MNKIKHIFDLLELGMVQFKQKFYTIITVLIRAHFRVHSAAHIRLLKHILNYHFERLENQYFDR